MSTRVRRDRSSQDAPTPAVAVVALASIAALVAAAGCESWPGRTEETVETGQAVATIGDDPITLTEVDDRIRQELFDEAFGDDASRLYAARRETVDEMIDERLLRAAAEAAGQTPQAFLEAEVRALPPITDEDVSALFEQNRERLPADATVEAFDGQLRAYLERGRVQQVLDDLRARSAVTITLPRQRVHVEATGPSLGPADAPITIVEFSDFQCPFCARVLPTIKTLRDRYPDEVRIVYRHLPLGFHPHARIAAIASVCADTQGRFWDFHDQLFAQQKALTREDLVAVATSMDLDTAGFTACLDDPASAEVVDADARAAEDVGATGTPTFFVNGLKLTGAQPLERFERLIAEERDLQEP